MQIVKYANRLTRPVWYYIVIRATIGVKYLDIVYNIWDERHCNKGYANKSHQQSLKTLISFCNKMKRI